MTAQTVTRVLHLVDRDSPPIAARAVAAAIEPDALSHSRVAALGDGPHVDWLTRCGVPFDIVPLRGRAEPFRSVTLGRWLARQIGRACGPVLIHAHSVRSAGCATVATILRRSLKAVPLLVEVYRQAEDRPMRWLASQARRRPIRFHVRSAALACVLGQAGVTGERIRVVPPVVSVANFGPDRPLDGRRALGLPADSPVLLSGGWCRRREGQKLAFWAAAILNMLDPRVRIVIPGDGPQRDTLIDWMARAGFAHMTVFPGRQFDWPELLSAADVLVFTDGRDERGPFEPDTTAVAWSMLAGVPVVATRSGGVEELISDGRTGLLVPPARPRELAMRVRQVLLDESLRTMLASNAKSQALEQFSRSEFPAKA